MGAQPPPPDHNRRTTIVEVEAAIESDIRDYAHGDTTDLIDKHFGSSPKVVEAAERIYNTLVKERWYIPGNTVRRSKWKGLPLKPKSENELYSPLTAILNAISKLCKDRTFDITWQDWHAKCPDSQFMVDMKPDILAVIKAAGTWWRALQTVIEVKKKADMLPAILQLLRYVRQALREQPDRRFMHGMVFSMHNLTVWHVDRSGALASEVFNVHEEPLKFIKVIIGFLMLKPEDLGWDPTMKMYVEDFDEDANVTRRYGVPSYTIKEKSDTGKNNAYERMWTISVPIPGAEPAESSSDDPDAPPPEEEEFVVFRALSLSRAEVLKGRATRIWKAWRMADMVQPKEERKVYVIKDCWRDERRGLEGALYTRALDAAGLCPGVALLYSHGKVRIGERKEVDCTFKLVRKNVKPRGESLDLRTAQSSAAVSQHHREDTRVLPSVTTSRHGSTTSTSWSRDYFASITGKCIQRIPRNRIHTRLVMASYGYPISKFLTLQELLGALHDAIKGHEWLFNKGILHRDISMGNIIITGLEAPNRGILIDLDNAIVWKDHEALIDDERTGTIAFMSYEILMDKEYFPKTVATAPTAPDGTILYKIKHNRRKEIKGVAHDYVHDLESFFWVLCWLCVAREGPGRARHFSTDGLNKEQEAQAIQIQNAIVTTFEQKSITGIADRKKNLLTSLGTFTDVIINSFTPYFEPLQDPLIWIHEELNRAYTSRNFEGLHQKFLDYLGIVEQALLSEDWEATDEKYGEMSEAVQKQRDEAKAVWDSPKLERIAQPNEATSSSNTRSSNKRRRADEELEPIAEQPEDESSSASSEERNTRSAARKRQRTAGPSHQQSEDAESVAADDVRSSSPLRGKGKAAKKAGKAKIAETKKAAAKTKATTAKTKASTSKTKATTAAAKAKAAETAAKTPARRSARLAKSKDN